MYRKLLLKAMGIVWVGFFLILFPRIKERAFGKDNPLLADVGVVVQPSIELSLSGGTSSTGRKTFFAGNTIDFGNVTFTHPETIGNGDAYIEAGHLKLEAVVDIAMVFSGASQVNLDLTRLPISPTPFYKTYYSLSLNRSEVANVIFEDPRKNRLKTLAEGAAFPLRLIFEITPQQKGRMNDRFRLEASAL